MTETCGTGCCFIVPPKVLRALGDLDTAIATERLRGQRLAFQELGLAAAGVPAGQKRRTVYDAHHAMSLPGELVRSEDGPRSKDPAANEAFESCGVTYDFFREILGRSSIDGRGMRLDSTVHYGRNYNNAFWNGRQMVYGDGDGKLFSGLTKALDVVGHELTHGVTQYAVAGGGLVYVGQPGALSESFSDVFGTLVKQWSLKQDVNAASWLVGEGIMGAAYGKALRSMKDPGTAWKGDDQPRDMDGYVEQGDVHTNSGIPNRAFYLAATAIGGFAWEKTGRIWYRALSMLRRDATFKDAAKATAEAAGLLFGTPERTAVEEAWSAVKVTVKAPRSPRRAPEPQRRAAATR